MGRVQDGNETARAALIGGLPAALAALVGERLDAKGWRVVDSGPGATREVGVVVRTERCRAVVLGHAPEPGHSGEPREAFLSGLKATFFAARAAGLALGDGECGRMVIVFESPPGAGGAPHLLGELVRGCAGAAVEVLAANLAPRVSANCILTDGTRFGEDSGSAGASRAGDGEVERTAEVAEMASALMTESYWGTGRVYCV